MHDLTSGPPLRRILLFALPLLLGNLFQQAYMFIDAAVVGQMLGTEALAALGAANAPVFLVIGFAWGASAGMAIPVAKAFGAGDRLAVRRYALAGALSSLALGVVLTLVGTFFSRHLLTLLQTPPEIIDQSTTYLTVLSIGMMSTIMYQFLAAILRALGDTRTPLLFLILASVVNVALIVLFLGVFNWGIAAAAVPISVGQAAAVIGCLLYIRAKVPLLRFSRQDFRVDREAIKETLKQGIPMAMQTSVMAVGIMVLQVAVNSLGHYAVAAFAAAARIEGFAMMPLMSFGVAVVTFTAQNRGARQYQRIRTAVLRMSMLAMALGGVLGLSLALAARPLARMFVEAGDVAVHDHVQTFFWIMAAAYVLQGLKFVLRGAFQGLGKPTIPSISMACETLLRILVAFVLVGPWGFAGAVLAAPLAWLTAVGIIVPAWLMQRRRLMVWELDDAVRGEPAQVSQSDQSSQLAQVSQTAQSSQLAQQAQASQVPAKQSQYVGAGSR